MNKTYGEIAYDAYCQQRDWKSFNGDPLPHFSEMRERQKAIAEAWEVAAKAVVDAVMNQTARG